MFLLIAVSSLVLVSSIEGACKKGVGMSKGKGKGLVEPVATGRPTGKPTVKRVGKPTAQVMMVNPSGKPTVGKPTAQVMMVNPSGKPTVWVVV